MIPLPPLIKEYTMIAFTLLVINNTENSDVDIAYRNCRNYFKGAVSHALRMLNSFSTKNTHTNHKCIVSDYSLKTKLS